MIKSKKIHLVATASVLAIAMAGATHATSINSEMSSTVNGSIQVSMEQPLFFGVASQLRGASKDDDVASIVVNSDGSPSSVSPGTNATVTIASQGNPGIVKIENGLPNQAITVAATPVDMVPVNPGESKKLSISAFTFNYSTGSAVTDASGNVDIFVGATLSTEDTNEPAPATDTFLAYADGQYEATIPVTVNY